jgi:hypothetical protein
MDAVRTGRLLVIALLIACIAGPVTVASLPIGHEEAIDDGDMPVSNDLGRMLGQVSESEIFETVSDLQGYGTRVYPSEGNWVAATYLHDRFDAIPGLNVEYQDDTYRNVIATLPGTGDRSNEVVVVGAHYDSASTDPTRSPGATDNGGGVGIVLELARVMSQYRFDRTIVFACWNKEEGGLKGSESYVADASARSAAIALYFNYDSACYDPDDEYVLDYVYNDAAQSIAKRLGTFNTDYGIGCELTEFDHNCVSDHVSFWDAGYPAVSTHSQDHAPEAHSPDDTIGLVSTAFAKKNAQLGMALIAETAGGNFGGADAPVVVVPGGVEGPCGPGEDPDLVLGNAFRTFSNLLLSIARSD